MRLRFTFASRRALSSVGQSRRLIISWSQVQALQGAQFGEVNRLQNASACVSLPSGSTEAELRRAFSSAGSERSPHTREVTGSSPVLPTTLKKPRTQVRGFLLARRNKKSALHSALFFWAFDWLRIRSSRSVGSWAVHGQNQTCLQCHLQGLQCL